MNPKRAKDLLPLISKELDLPISLLNDLVDFYWDGIHKDLVSLEYFHVMIPNLGTFHIKGDLKLKESIDKIKKKMPKEHPKMTTRMYAKRKQNLEMIQKMEKLIEDFQEQKSERTKIRQIRKDVRAVKESLEGQGENPGGSI